MKRNTKIKCKSDLIQGVILFIVSFIVLSILSIEEYYYDANTYAKLALSFWQDETFSLLHYPKHLRGVSYPLLMAPFMRFDIIWGWRMFASLVMVIIVVFVPKLLWDMNDREDILFCKRLALLGLLWLFWRGLFMYPLSDAVAVALLCVGLYFAIKKDSIWGFCISGICMYMCYNTRTIYVFSIVVLLIAKLWIGRKDIRKMSAFLLAFAIGVLLAATPQIVVNKNVHDTFSMAVITEKSDEFPYGLFMWQLGGGFSDTEYETYVGDPEEYPVPSLHFYDIAGNYMLDKLELNPYSMNMKQVLKVMLKYPFDTLGIYTRHVINMLNPIWGEVYIRDIHKIKIHLTIINYIFMISCGTYVYIKRSNIKDAITRQFGRWCSLLCLLSPCIMIIPGYVEQRFFFPAYMLMYCFMIWGMGKNGIKEVVREWKAHPYYYGVVFVMIFSGLCAVWGVTLASTRQEVWIGIF